MKTFLEVLAFVVNFFVVIGLGLGAAVLMAGRRKRPLAVAMAVTAVLLLAASLAIAMTNSNFCLRYETHYADGYSYRACAEYAKPLVQL